VGAGGDRALRPLAQFTRPVQHQALVGGKLRHRSLDVSEHRLHNRVARKPPLESAPPLFSAIFITARLQSERLPGKVLTEIRGRSVLARQVERLRTARRPGAIVVCTTTEAGDDAIEAAARESGVEVFRGHPDDILVRWRDAADAFGVDLIVACDGDDLFCDPVHVDRVVECHEASGADYITCEGLPLGAAPIGIAVPALRRVCELKQETTTEGQGRFFQDESVVSRARIEADPRVALAEARMTLDYPEDLEFFTTVVEELEQPGELFSLEQIVALLRQRPEIMAINAGRNEEYWARFNARYRPVELKQ
jgi:spore coat polysaccharide biosynthesis protein SpsF